ncbi:helix-turn-helix transcriptional regulator [Nocardia sp. NPDC049149]|uniref:helix-turn-helix transcriptional regulator n=1 Tax=Nocardia sp. NPDC049149 TaxID=3364315 RepID=UPI0037173EE0
MTEEEIYLRAKGCEELTGIPEATWRWWAHVGYGPESFKLGPRRRVWKRSVVLAWIAEQERQTARGGEAA